MNAPHLNPQHIQQARDMGINTLYVFLEGGSDEGFVETRFERPTTELAKEMRLAWVKLEEDIKEYIYDNHPYSGAGDGTPYGEEYTYNFADNSVEGFEWSMQRHDSPILSTPIAYEA